MVILSGFGKGSVWFVGIEVFERGGIGGVYDIFKEVV